MKEVACGPQTRKGSQNLWAGPLPNQMIGANLSNNRESIHLRRRSANVTKEPSTQIIATLILQSQIAINRVGEIHLAMQLCMKHRVTRGGFVHVIMNAIYMRKAILFQTKICHPRTEAQRDGLPF